MTTQEKTSVYEASDSAVRRKASAERDLRVSSLTRVLGVTAMLLLLLLMVIMMIYLIYLHVRLSKLEQCPCVTTRNPWAANDHELDAGALIDKVRAALSDRGTEYVPPETVYVADSFCL